MREETKKGFAGFLCPRDPLDPHTETNYCLGECVEPCLPRPLLAMLAEARDHLHSPVRAVVGSIWQRMARGNGAWNVLTWRGYSQRL